MMGQLLLHSETAISDYKKFSFETSARVTGTHSDLHCNYMYRASIVVTRLLYPVQGQIPEPKIKKMVEVQWAPGI